MSHEEQIDLRIRRTHKFLQEAANHLVEDMKPFHKDIDAGRMEENLVKRIEGIL